MFAGMRYYLVRVPMDEDRVCSSLWLEVVGYVPSEPERPWWSL
jgi:hypothetical protein